MMGATVGYLAVADASSLPHAAELVLVLNSLKVRVHPAPLWSRPTFSLSPYQLTRSYEEGCG